MIMILLPWWMYVLIGTVAFTCSFGAVWLASIAFEKSTSDDGSFPCLARADNEHGCVTSQGHTMADDLMCFCGADHGSPDFSHDQMRQTNAAGDVVIDENPGYLPGSAPLPPLPQRLNKVPVQPRPWPGCFHQSSDGRCRLVKSHIGPHDYV